MIEYQKILSVLGLDNRIIDCANGRLSCPIAGVEVPPYWYGYPPALIPIWSQGASPKYFGVWKHWFVKREQTYVEMFISADRLTSEIARTPEQFLCFAVISAIVEQDGINNEIESFCRSAKIDNLEEIDRITLEFGDNPSGFIGLEQFKEKIPLNSISNTMLYSGDFPFIGSDGALINYETCTEFEMDRDIVRDKSINMDFPEWLASGASKLYIFDKYVSEGEFGRAWLSLNSRGWSIADARVALTRLAESSGDLDFNCLASACLSVADLSAGGY